MEIKDVMKDLGEDAKLFDFDEKDGVVAAKLKKFYKDRNEFAKIAKRVKDNANGVYVPKDQGGPYFKFKGDVGKGKVYLGKEAVSTATTDKKDVLINDAIAYLEHAIEKLRKL